MFDWIAGHEKNVSGPNDTEQKIWVPGKLPLFSNVEDRGPGDRTMARRPVTRLIDSEELEGGEALSSDFRKLAGPEIEAFKSDLRLRGEHAEAEALADADLLREVINTVGQVWPAGRANPLRGVRIDADRGMGRPHRQVIGRALRRVSYDPVGQGDAGNPMFEPEYADVLGIPSSFIPANSAPDYKPPKKQTRVEAVDGREDQEISFPRVPGYRVVMPPGRRLSATFSAESHMTIDPTMAPAETINARWPERKCVCHSTICERCEYRPLPFIWPDAPSTDGFATLTATRSRGCFLRYCRLLGVGWISACTSLQAATLPI